MTFSDRADTARSGPSPPLAHGSYSSLTAYLKCAKAYQLNRILGLPEMPSWWGIGGSAVHEATEANDRKRYEETGR